MKRNCLLLVSILFATITLTSCNEKEDLENASLQSYWVSGNYNDTDHIYHLWIKNDSLFSFDVEYHVYDGISWDQISGIKTYTGHYSTEGKKLILNADSLFLRTSWASSNIDIVPIRQILFNDCEYSINGSQLQINYTLVLDTPPSVKRTLNFTQWTY